MKKVRESPCNKHMAAEKTQQKFNFQFHIRKEISTKGKKIQVIISLAHHIVEEKNLQSQ